MTQRSYHVAAISALLLGLVAGGVSWTLDGAPFWIAAGIGFLLVIAGLILAGRAGGRGQDGGKDGG